MRWLPATVWMVIIVSLSLWPSGQIPRVNWPYIDKAVHLLMYGILAIAVLYGFSGQYDFHKRRWTYATLTVLLAAIFGTIMELLQYFITSGRNFESQDILANIIGSLAAAIIFANNYQSKKA